MHTDLQLDQPRLTESLGIQHITNFSHEVRTPLSIIILSTELLKKHGHQCSEDQRHAYLHQIHLAARQMNQTLNQILFELDQDLEQNGDQSGG